MSAARTLDHMCLISRAEPVVDVDHGNARCARIEHSQKSRHAAEAGAVTHRRGNGDHGACGHPADHAGKRPLHTRYGHYAAGACDFLPMRQEAMDARNPHIIQAHHARSEHLGGNGRLLGAVQVAGTRARHRDVAIARRLCRRAEQAQLRNGSVLERRRSPRVASEQRSPHRFRLLRFKPGDEHARLTGIAQGQADTGDLVCRLAGSVDHLASARAPCAIGVDLREAQVGIALVGKASLGIDRAYRARRHLLEHVQDLLRFHKPAPFPPAKRGPSSIPNH